MTLVALPNEILLMIARACVEPWTLFGKAIFCEYLPTQEETKFDRPLEDCLSIRGIPQLKNLQLVSKLFRNDVQNAIRERFDGQLHIGDYSNNSLSEGSRSHYIVPQWLLSLITTCFVRDSFLGYNDDIVHTIARRIPSFRHLIIDAGVLSRCRWDCGILMTINDVLENPLAHRQILSDVFHRHAKRRTRWTKISEVLKKVQLTEVYYTKLVDDTMEVVVEYVGKDWWPAQNMPEVKLKIKWI